MPDHLTDLAPAHLVAPLGCGAIGLSAVMGAVVAGATTIIAIDLVDERLATASLLEATHTLNPGRDRLVAQIRAAQGDRLRRVGGAVGVQAPGSTAQLLALHADGRLPLDMIERTYRFADLDQAISDTASGRAVKAVLLMP